MTVVTVAPAAGESWWGTDESARRVAGNGPSAGHLAAAGRPFPSPREPVVNHGDQGGSPPAGSGPKPVERSTHLDGSPTTFAATAATVSPQVAPAAHAGGRTTPGQVPPGLATLAGNGPETAALALVEAMDGSERAVLLRHIAATSPAVVHGGITWLAAWRADVAERRRVASNRKSKDRRRRQRRQAAGSG